MNAPRRLSELAPGLVIAAGRRTITAPEVSEFAARYGSADEMGGKARSASRRKTSAQPANHWLICAIAEQLARTAVGTSCRSAGALSIERLSWPKCAHAGDDLELQIEVLDRHVTVSGAAGYVRWRWMLVTSEGEKVLDFVFSTLLEDSARCEGASGAAPPIAYKVSKAAEMLGVSRYRLYEAIRDQELRAYRPNARADLMILPEDLREWVTRYPVQPENSRGNS